MAILTDEQILECVLNSGKVSHDGPVRQNDGRLRHEFHIVIYGADAHRMSAHMEAKRVKAEEDAKPKPKKFVGGDHQTDYANKACA